VTGASAISSAIFQELHLLRFLTVFSQSWLFRTGLKSYFFCFNVKIFHSAGQKLLYFENWMMG
jgi:hypothetical protein